MRLRTELLAGAVLAALLGVGAAALGARGARAGDEDPRRSTFLAGPSGAMGFAQALERLGVRVERLRRSPLELGAWLRSTVDTADHANVIVTADSVVVPGPDTDTTRTLIAVLGPSNLLSVAEARALVTSPFDLLLAGPSAGLAMQCLGYGHGGWGSTDTSATWYLVAAPARQVTDSSGGEDGTPATCTGRTPATVDTLRRVSAGVVALRLTYEDGRAAVLVADDGLFANRALRTTDAGLFALGLVVPRYARVIVDEYHHGFVTSGSLAGALVAWSARSPWGWAAWQLAVVGLIALLASAARFGPVLAVIDRRRRSPLEHVRALATALAAARGHAVAIDLTVRGLRRRLSRGGGAARGDTRAWLDGLAPAVRTADGTRALDTLRELTGRPAGAEEVRRAANAVEDLWKELNSTPPPPRPS